MRGGAGWLVTKRNSGIGRHRDNSCSVPECLSSINWDLEPCVFDCDSAGLASLVELQSSGCNEHMKLFYRRYVRKLQGPNPRSKIQAPAGRVSDESSKAVKRRLAIEVSTRLHDSFLNSLGSPCYPSFISQICPSIFRNVIIFVIKGLS